MRPTTKLFAFEKISPALELVPLAARRALDRAGLKVGLAAWIALPLGAREAIVRAGSRDLVDPGAVREALAEVEARSIEAAPEPDAALPPEGLEAALGEARPVSREAWIALTGLERWVLASLAARERTTALREAYDEITAVALP